MTESAPIIYRSYQDEKPVLLGGREVTGFSPYKDGILKADVGVQGFKDVRFRMLVFNGKRQELARYPNRRVKSPDTSEWAYVDGKTYRLSAWMKGESELTPVELGAYSWKKEAHSWAVQSTAAVTREWRQYELLFRLPKEGENDYKPTMDMFWWRINFPKGSGKFWVDDVSLREAELADEWESWQAKGMDKNSVVADPLFVDPEHDNYQLKPESPALKLGFEQIPFDKIGPYQDPIRASWPIIEAPGARESALDR